MSDINNLFRAYKKVYLTEAPAAPTPEPIPKATSGAKQIAKRVETDISKVAAQPVRTGGRLSFDDVDAAVAGNWSAIEKPPGDLGDINIGVWNGYKILQLDLERAYHSVPKENILIYGDAGVGKSGNVLAAAKKIAERVSKQFAGEEGRQFVSWGQASADKKIDLMEHPEKYFIFWDVRVAGLEPSDIVGIPDINTAKKYLTVKQGPWIYSLSRPESMGVLFLDEINQGAQQVLKAFFEVVYDRSMGGTPMSEHISIVGAGNLGTIYGNQDIPPALTDRFTAGFLVVDANEWLHWAEEVHLDPLILGFVKSNPGDNFSFKPIPGQKSAKLPTPRSMEKLSHVLQKLYREYKDAGERGIHMPEPLMQAMSRKAAHICGPDWGNEFMAYVQHMRTLTLKEILGHTQKGEFGTASKNYIGAGKQHAIMQWYTDKLEKTAANLKAGKEPTPNDIELLTSVAIISNDLAKQAPEWLATLWSTFKYVMPQAWIAIMEFLENADYDPAIKRQFITQTIPAIRLNVTSPENITYNSQGQPELKLPTAPTPATVVPKRNK